MNAQPESSTRLRGGMRVLVQAVWLMLIGMLLATFAAGIPVRFSNLLKLVSNEDQSIFASLPPAVEAPLFSRLGPEEADALKSIGLSQGLYAGYVLAFEVALALACAVIGLLIFWRRSDDWMALWVSLAVVLVGTNGLSTEVPSLATVWPATVLWTISVGFLGMISLVHILFLLPDGRWVPRWTLNLAAGSTGSIVAYGLYLAFESWRTQMIDPFGVGVIPAALVIFPIWVGGLGLGVLNQIYRYRWVSGPVQRQQTKWLVVGLAAGTLGIVLNALFLYVSSQQSGLPRLLSFLIRTPVVNLCMSLLPICLAFSIFRYRLWDIDLVIRRTLQYTLLTGLLALAYFGGVVSLQSLLSPVAVSAPSPLVTVITTLGIAALFFPLRRRVQAFIDRRFYRAKYDAEQALAQFAATAREEVDMDKLAGALLGVVEQTMRPEHVSLLIKPYSNRGLRSASVGGRTGTARK